MLLSACTRPARERGDDRPTVVASVSPITSLVDSIGGDRIRLVGLVPEGADSHTFDPPPRDARVAADATLRFVNGMHLDDSIGRLVRSAGDGTTIVRLGDTTVPRQEWIYDFSFPEEKGDPNPHVWTDPVYAAEYADVIADTLVKAQPAHGNYFRQRHQTLRAALEDLHRAIEQALATVPPEHRKLVTYHDSFPYFAKRYGWTVLGAAQPSDFSEPSAREIARLIDQIRSEGVPAIFGSEVFPSTVLEQIARETGVKYVAELRDDDLPGEPGEPEHSYFGLMKFDVKTMVEALGGNAAALESLRPPSIREYAEYR